MGARLMVVATRHVHLVVRYFNSFAVNSVVELATMLRPPLLDVNNDQINTDMTQNYNVFIYININLRPG